MGSVWGYTLDNGLLVFVLRQSGFAPFPKLITTASQRLDQHLDNARGELI